MTISYCYMHGTPVGRLLLAADSVGLRFVLFQNPDTVSRSSQIEPRDDWVEDEKPLSTAVRQLKQYFAGERRHFDVPLNPQGTPFQMAVWKALRTIPYGVTCSYGDIAKRIDCPNASRAVGAANGRNPISIIVPCHRVIGANGKLTGFGGGLDCKQTLLDLEQGCPQLPFSNVLSVADCV